MVLQCKHYAFTVWPNNLNNKFATVKEWFEFAKDRTAGVKYLVMQLEVAPTTKQVHAQGFVSFQQTKRINVVANHFGGVDKEVFQKMKKGATPWDNKVYCTKQDSRLAGCVPFEYGEVPQPGEKPAADESRLEAFIKAMDKDGLTTAMDNDPSTYVRSHSGLDKLAGIYQGRKIPQVREVTVYVAYGATSGSGKSWFAHTWDSVEHTFPVPDLRHKERLNLDGYTGQRTLLLEDYDGEIEFRSLLRMLDKYKAQFNTKGGMVWGVWDTVIITSNKHPSRWYDDSVDPWGLTDHSPLRRRIDFLLEFSGVWPTSKVSVNGEKATATTWLHNRAATEAARKEELASDESAAPAAGGSTSSNPPAAPGPTFESVGDALIVGWEQPESPTVEQLVEEWEQQDQALQNDFIQRFGPRSPLRFDRTDETERFLLQGEEGDGLADDGWNLF